MSGQSGKTGPKPAGRLHPLLKLVMFLSGFALSGLVLGYIAFVVHIHRAGPPAGPPKVDGIVVLTGADGNRLAVGARLFKSGQADRLLISGVNTSVSPKKMQSLLGLDSTTFRCCVDLDFAARNTRENATETANWARTLDYERLLLVTSAYHMPRAQTELRTALTRIGLGEVEIIPWPIPPTADQAPPWWGGRLYLREYGKLLLSFARNPGGRSPKGARQ